jgi:hypothetical protein
MRIKTIDAVAVTIFALMMMSSGSSWSRAENQPDKHPIHPQFRTSDRCVACHNGLKTSSGEDISIGFQWSASIMANSSRDPYWQGSLRRESIDHPAAQADIENECSTCHMPASHFANQVDGRMTQVFSHLPLKTTAKGDRAPADGVTCSVCHQIAPSGLGTGKTFNGEVDFAQPPKKDQRPEYGPFDIDAGHKRVMQSSTGGFVPMHGDQIRDAGLCGSCHTLITDALGPNGEKIARFPEQVPFLEWQHSDYAKKETCQSCHMPVVDEAVAVTALYGKPREGMHRHVFVGGNFLIEGMLQDHRQDLDVQAQPEVLDAAIKRTVEFLQTKTAKVTICGMDVVPGQLTIHVEVKNLTGHKLPTAYPSRRAWLHVAVQDAHGRLVFESGALNPDGSIVGNDNDADPLRFEPHYSEITSPQQVEIYEPILKDSEGRVTTGLLHAVGYLKDNRLLPTGFNKLTAEKDIAVTGKAADDPDFTDQGSLVRYKVPTANATGPFYVTVELWYQPIGFRWAHNLGAYQAAEPQRLVRYYEQAANKSAVVLAKAEATAITKR